jgi:hypothetical protein
MQVFTAVISILLIWEALIGLDVCFTTSCKTGGGGGAEAVILSEILVSLHFQSDV